MSLTITGIGPIPSNVAEYTTGEVQRRYLEYVAILKQIFDKRSANPNATPLTEGDFTTLIETLHDLQDLALNGEADPISGATFYLTNSMAINLDLIFRSLKAVGIDLNTPSSGVSNWQDLIQNWQSLAGFGVEDILVQANSVSGSTRTLQSMVELEYVKQGNDLLSNKLSDLEEQLKTTQGILDTLTLIQNIANQITVTNRGDFAFPPTLTKQISGPVMLKLQAAMSARGDSGTGQSFLEAWNREGDEAKAAIAQRGGTQAEIDDYVNSPEYATKHDAADIFSNYVSNDIQRFINMYKVAASTQFSQLFPTATPTSTAATDLVAAKQKLMQELIDLESKNPTATRTVQGSLASFIYRVALDISSHFSGINLSQDADQIQAAYRDAVSAWILDNQDQRISSGAANQAGSIQNNITQAITASESLNDQQKQLVQNYMFIFQQFYQSASAVLQKVSQIVEKMAQGIGR